VTIQLPPLKSPSGTGPHAVPPEDALSSAGGLRHTALGRGDRAPRTTSANDGYHRAAPPRNLGIRTGQRPTIHRLHQCRGPKGPRASVTTARGRRGVKLVAPRCGGRPPPFLRQWPTRDQRANSRSETACLAGKKKEPRRAVSGLVAGIPRLGGLPTLAFTYTLRPSLDAPLARKRSSVPSRVAGGPVCMGWSVRWSILPYKVGHPGSPPTRAGRDLGFVRRRASCWLGPWYALSPKREGRVKGFGGAPSPGPRGPR
jgi:hypothetical protein